MLESARGLLFKIFSKAGKASKELHYTSNPHHLKHSLRDLIKRLFIISLSSFSDVHRTRAGRRGSERRNRTGLGIEVREGRRAVL